MSAKRAEYIATLHQVRRHLQAAHDALVHVEFHRSSHRLAVVPGQIANVRELSAQIACLDEVIGNTQAKGRR